MATGDMFLELKGGNKFDGESPDDTYKNAIQILSYSIGVSNTGTGSVGSGSGASRSSFSDLTITKYTDKSSPNFLLACASGAHIDEAIIHVRKAGGDKNIKDYLTITMKEVFVSSFHHSGADGGGLPTESATLNFASVKVKYMVQDEKGALTAGPDLGWDAKKNIKL